MGGIRLARADLLPVRRDLGQQADELLTLGGVKRREEGTGRAGQRGRRAALQVLAARGQVDQEGPTVPRMADPLHQRLFLKFVEQVHHRSAVDRHRGGQLDLGQRPGFGQRAQYAPGPGREAQRLQPLRGQGLRGLLGHEQQLAHPSGRLARRPELAWLA